MTTRQLLSASSRPASATPRRRTRPLTFRRAAAAFSCLTFALLPHTCIASTSSGDGDGVGNGDSTSTCVASASSYKLPQQLIDAANGAGFPGPPQLFGLVASIQAGWDPALGAYETPMAVRFTWLISALNWNCAAVYSADWDDALTHGDPLKGREQYIVLQYIAIYCNNNYWKHLGYCNTYCSGSRYCNVNWLDGQHCSIYCQKSRHFSDVIMRQSSTCRSF